MLINFIYIGHNHVGSKQSLTIESKQQTEWNMSMAVES